MQPAKAMSLDKLKNALSSGDTSLKLIDIRSAAEFERLHIPGAEHIPAELLIEASVAFRKNDVIVCVCNKGHERSRHAAELLVSAGFENAYYLESGVKGWFDSLHQ